MLESPTSEKPFGCPANHVWRGGFAMGWLKRASHEVLEDETHNGWVAAFWKICVSRHFFAFFVGLRTPPSWTDPWLNTLKSKWACSWLWRRQIGSVPTTTSIQPCLPQRHQRPGERTRADVRTRIHLNVWQEQAEKNKQTTLARCEAAKHCFSLFDILLFGFHFIDLSNFRISSDLRLAVLQGLGKDLRGWKVEIGVSSWLRPCFHEDRLDFTRTNALLNFCFVPPKLAWRWSDGKTILEFLSIFIFRKWRLGCFFLGWGGWGIDGKDSSWDEVGCPFKSHVVDASEIRRSSSWYRESYTFTRVLYISTGAGISSINSMKKKLL